MKRNARWIAVHTRCPRDSKVAGLSSKTVRWDWLLCLLDAKEQEDEGGWASFDHLVNSVGIDPSSADELIAAGLLDRNEGGRITVHSWDEWQVRRSDPTAAARQKAHRDKRRGDSNVTGNVTSRVTVTPPPVSLSYGLNSEFSSEDRETGNSVTDNATRNVTVEPPTACTPTAHPMNGAPPQGNRRLDGIGPPTGAIDPEDTRRLLLKFPAASQTAPRKFHHALEDTVARLVAESRFPDAKATIAFLAAKAEAYAASKDGKGRYAKTAANWLTEGKYDDNPEAWNRPDPQTKNELEIQRRLDRRYPEKPVDMSLLMADMGGPKK